MDSRCVPHTLSVAVGSADLLRHFSIEKAAERIDEADVRRAARAMGELTHGLYP